MRKEMKALKSLSIMLLIILVFTAIFLIEPVAVVMTLFALMTWQMIHMVIYGNFIWEDWK